MKKIIKTAFVLLGATTFGAFAYVGSCGTVMDDPCANDGYSIVETEPNVYWPHNEMAAAHWVGYKYHEKVRSKRVVRRSKTYYQKRIAKCGTIIR